MAYSLQIMEKSDLAGSDGFKFRMGSAYAYLLRHVQHERIMRQWMAKIYACWPDGLPHAVSFEQIQQAYEKLPPKGET
jgi:hypothetical protein